MLVLITYESFARAYEACNEISRAKIILLPEEFFNSCLFESRFLFDLFNLVCFELDAIAPDILRSSTVCLTVEVEVDCKPLWNPLAVYEPGEPRCPRETLVAWLVLAYPEVRWVFWGSREQTGPLAWHCCEIGSVEDTKTPCAFVTPLFDPSDLRAWIRSCGGYNRTADPTATRSADRESQIAVAIDEETTYAYFLGYAARKIGYRVWAVDSWNAMENLLGTDDASLGQPDLALEDMFLSFPDRPGKFNVESDIPEDRRRLSDLEFRDRICPKLKQTTKRVFVTVGANQSRWTRKTGRYNAQYEKDTFSRRPKKVFKPVGSLYTFLKQAGLPYKAEPPTGFGRHRSARRHDPSQEPTEPRHSAPGVFLMIAKRLLERSGRLLEQCYTPERAVHAAVLASEAKEILGGLTPTTYLEAICLQHEAEVCLESLFMGVEYNIALRQRFKDIEQDVHKASLWFNKDTRKRSAINAQLTIVERLAARFAAFRQIEEEMNCLSQARWLRFKFWMAEKRWRLCFWPLFWYISTALKSILNFAVLILALLAAFAGAVYVLSSHAPNPQLGYFDAALVAGYFFATLQPPDNFPVGHENPALLALFTLIGVVSVLNFGLLISHIYLLAVRR